MKRLKLVFIVDESMVMLPDWLEGVVAGLNMQYYEIAAICPVTTKHQKTIFSYLIDNLRYIPKLSLIKVAYKGGKLIGRRILFAVKLSSQPGTVGQAARKFKVECINITNVNAKEFLAKLKKIKPDIIISSGSQIFKRELLELPTIACINRHSALLPSYKGLFPIFRALLNKEKFIGVTIHYMVPKIDEGGIIYQTKYKLDYKKSLFELYDQSYKISIVSTINALEIIRNKKSFVAAKDLKPSYYSFPKQEDWKIFFSKGYRFI